MKATRFVYICISFLLMLSVSMFLSLITCRNGELDDIYQIHAGYKLLRIREADTTQPLSGKQLYASIRNLLNEDTDLLLLDTIDDIGLGMYDPSHKLIESYGLPKDASKANCFFSDKRYSYTLNSTYLSNHPELYKKETGTVLGTVKEIPNDHYLIYNLFSYSKLQGDLIVKGSDELLNMIRQNLDIHHYEYTEETFSYWNRLSGIINNPFFAYMLFSYVFVFIGLSYFIYHSFACRKKIFFIKQVLGASRKAILLENLREILFLSLIGCIPALLFHHWIVQQLQLTFIRESIWIDFLAMLFSLLFLTAACTLILNRNLDKEGYLYE